jgi:MGT family glycosyltransferase
LYFNIGDINIAYTSKYFVSHIEYYDDSFKFIGPPIYDRKENLDFPFEKLEGKKVIYISLGTVFNNTNSRIYDVFFKTFANTDVIVVMAAYNVDLSSFYIPENFIVRNYVPQSEILKYTDVAITHGGMNSMSDLLYNNIPFVAIPIGADQPYLAARASELGATISLDKDKLTPEILKNAVEKVLTDQSYIENIKKISTSFKESGGYKKAIEEISKFKKEKGILS